MAKSAEEIVREYRNRQLARGPFFEGCRQISQVYDNELVLPLPEVSEKEAAGVANLLAVGIDQHAMRVTSVLPDIQAPPVKIGDKASEKRAAQRRRAAIGWWEINEYDLLMRKRARWLGAYAQSPVRIIPDRKLRQPKWSVRSPLETYPSDTDGVDMRPESVIFATARTIGWLRRQYPDIPVNEIILRDGNYTGSRPPTDDERVEVIEYLDGEETVVLVVGDGEYPHEIVREAEFGVGGARIRNLGPLAPSESSKWTAEILRVPNRLDGMCPVIVPGRISLNGLKGQFDDSVPLYRMEAALMAMEVNAVANAIWPDTWLIARPQDTAKIIKAADGRKGIVGIVEGGEFHEQQIQPGFQTYQTMDRLERGQRVSSGIPADFTGESPSNIRTGRRGDSVLSSTVDFTIQEHQQILGRSSQHELELAVAVDMAYFRNVKKSFYVSWKNGKGRLDYTPKDIWTEDRTLKVSYAKAGTDVNALNVEVGQLVGIGLMSKLTGARIHPSIVDPEFEHEQVVFESLEQAALASIQQQASQGALPLPDLARIMQLVRAEHMTLVDAVAQAQDEAQKRQAAPTEPSAPEAMPGLAQPGQGAEQGAQGGPAAIGPPSPSADNLVQLLRGLRTGGQIAAQGAP